MNRQLYEFSDAIAAKDSVSAELASNKTTAVSTDPSEKAFEKGHITLAFSMLKMTALPDSTQRALDEDLRHLREIPIKIQNHIQSKKEII